MIKETSELLQKTRLEKKLTLEEISAQTKIQLHILKGLDEGNIDAINKIYIKGFLKQYANALGLRAEEVLELFSKETASSYSTPTPIKAAPISRVDNQEMQDKTNVLWFRAPSKFISVAGVMVIVLLLGSIYFFSMKYASYSQETVANDTKVSTEPPSPDQAPQIEKLIDKNEELALPKPAEPESSTPNPEPTPAEDAKPKIVSIEASDTVTIEASWSTGKKEIIKLRANNRHVFYYAKKIKLVVSDGGLVKITANDKELEKNEAGKPVTLNFE